VPARGRSDQEAGLGRVIPSRRLAESHDLCFCSIIGERVR
jgi:hypothetical protein